MKNLRLEVVPDAEKNPSPIFGITYKDVYKTFLHAFQNCPKGISKFDKMWDKLLKIFEILYPNFFQKKIIIGYENEILKSLLFSRDDNL